MHLPIRIRQSQGISSMGLVKQQGGVPGRSFIVAIFKLPGAVWNVSFVRLTLFQHYSLCYVPNGSIEKRPDRLPPNKFQLPTRSRWPTASKMKRDVWGQAWLGSPLYQMKCFLKGLISPISMPSVSPYRWSARKCSRPLVKPQTCLC